MTAFPFERLPGFSRLFCDCCSHKDAEAARFPANALLFSDAEHWRNVAESNTERARVLSAIEATMRDAPANELQRENIRHLERSTALTVITGQQVGLLGGPLYTLLKAWSAVQTARALSERHAGLDFVPVFWIADNDHDIAETAAVSLLDKNGDARHLRLAWRDGMPERVAASDVRFDAGVGDALESVRQTLSPTEFTPEIFALLEEVYAPGYPIARAFLRIMNFLLAESGILFVYASALQREGLFAPMIRKEIAEPSVAERALSAASAWLEERGYHTQARAASINAFLHSDGKRLKINRLDNADGTFVFQAGDKTYSQAELLALAEARPEAFTPNVLLRPLAQDWMFPNACYIGGPGEVGYLAQLREYYEAMGVSMSAVSARHSATLLDVRAAQFFAKPGQILIEFEGFMRSIEAVERDATLALERKDVAEAFARARVEQEALYKGLQEIATSVDPTLTAAADRAKTQAIHSLDDLLAKTRKAEKRHEETTLTKIRKIHALAHPHGVLQERALSPLYFANKIGVSALSKRLRELAALPNEAHYLAPLSGEGV